MCMYASRCILAFTAGLAIKMCLRVWFANSKISRGCYFGVLIFVAEGEGVVVLAYGGCVCWLVSDCVVIYGLQLLYQVIRCMYSAYVYLEYKRGRRPVFV